LAGMRRSVEIFSSRHEGLFYMASINMLDNSR
jgi:hypothetical protein